MNAELKQKHKEFIKSFLDKCYVWVGILISKIFK